MFGASSEAASVGLIEFGFRAKVVKTTEPGLDLARPAGLKVGPGQARFGCFRVCCLKAKFHYTSWFGASSEAASVMEFGREPASSC